MINLLASSAIIDFKSLQDTTSKCKNVRIANNTLKSKLCAESRKIKVERENNAFKSIFDSYDNDAILLANTNLIEMAEDQDNASMRCSERDIFHQFHDLLLLKTCQLKL